MTNLSKYRSPVAELESLNQRIVGCSRCPRLREHCDRISVEKTARFRSQAYYGLPVPNFGDPNARLLIVGLAPAGHGANRTGRMFTGDRSGDWLFRAMSETGFANQPTGTDLDDGLTLHDALITASIHCAPPGNRPATEELANCSDFLDQTLGSLERVRVVLCLGRIAFDSVMRLFQRQGLIKVRSRFRFAHGAVHKVTDAPVVICSYHPSQQNTFTGRLTRDMLNAVFEQAGTLLG